MMRGLLSRTPVRCGPGHGHLRAPDGTPGPEGFACEYVHGFCLSLQTVSVSGRGLLNTTLLLGLFEPAPKGVRIERENQNSAPPGTLTRSGRFFRKPVFTRSGQITGFAYGRGEDPLSKSLLPLYRNLWIVTNLGQENPLLRNTGIRDINNPDLLQQGSMAVSFVEIHLIEILETTL